MGTHPIFESDFDCLTEMNEKQFELSRYELNRKPQELILDDTEIKVQRKSLNALLMCPICLDVLRNTMTTKECLHRFCSECITTALRSGNNVKRLASLRLAVKERFVWTHLKLNLRKKVKCVKALMNLRGSRFRNAKTV